MSLSSLQVLADNRNALLLAEVAALLHDVGKLSTQFIDQMSLNPSSHSSDFSHENAVEQIPGFGDEQFLYALRDPKLCNLLRWSQIQRNEQIGQVLDLILHHDSPRHSAFLVRLLNRCDGFDSGADKGTTRQEGLPKEAKQESANTFIATAFGCESRLDEVRLDIARVQLTKMIASELSALPQSYRDLLKQIQSEYRIGLAETRRSANDVTLWDHSFSVATLYKTSLAALLINNTLNIDNLRWRLLRVNFDVLGLYAKAVKIADLLGYQRVVEDACESIKKLVEEEYPLGNEVYRDTTGIYFTFPDLDLPADLAQEIRRRVEEVEPELAPRIAVTVGDGANATEQLKGILAKARQETMQALGQPFDGQNLSGEWQKVWSNLSGNANWELCPVCRLRPMKEGEEACDHCLNRRGSRIAAWQQDPRRTIWMDELADANGRVALIVGKFGLDDWLSGDLVRTMLVKAAPNTPDGCVPKNPSPARLRRIWETCQQFWTKTVQQNILDTLPKRERWLLEVQDKSNLPPDGVVCDGTLNGQPISVWRVDNALLTVSLVPEKPEPGQLSVSWEHDGRKGTGEYQVQGVQTPPAKYLCYYPTLTLLASPDQFLALVPATDALEIADKIREEYARQFSKVQNRLPLFLGVVFFPRKTPLLAVMDTARRMLGVMLKEEQWTIECCRLDAQELHCYVRLSQGEQRLVWQVPVKMGDNTTEDAWYPYIFIERLAGGTSDSRKYLFQHDGRWLVHVNDLKEGDEVTISPSRFAYFWLEHTAKRFEFDPQSDVLLLDELPRLREIWERLRHLPEMTDTQLRNVQALLESKGAGWEETSDEFRNLVQTTLKRTGMLNAVTLEDVLSGRFARCLELHMKILKLRLKEVHNEQQPGATTA